MVLAGFQNISVILELPISVLTPNQVCKTLSFYEISWNRCLRSFLFKWCHVLMVKMIIMCGMPLFIIFYKLIKKNYLKEVIILQLIVNMQ